MARMGDHDDAHATLSLTQKEGEGWLVSDILAGRGLSLMLICWAKVSSTRNGARNKCDQS